MLTASAWCVFPGPEAPDPDAPGSEDSGGLVVLAVVVGGAGCGDFVLVVFGPVDEGLDGGVEGGAEGGEGVVDAWGDDGVDGAGDEAVAFELAEGDGEHAVADALDVAVEFGEAEGVAFEVGDGEEGPFVGDAVEDVSDFAALSGVPLEYVVVVVGSCAVTW